MTVRPEDRLTWLRALQEAQGGRGAVALDRLLYERLSATLREYTWTPREKH